MDAFARQGHIGLLYTDNGDENGNDYILEARCNDCGTNIFTESYRSDGDYRAIRRSGWTQDCYPNCPSVTQEAPLAVVR